MRSNTQSFNPANYNFSWTSDNWYDWDDKAAHKAAMQDRNAEAKRLKLAGQTVRKGSRSGNLITRGGIGSGHPQIEMIVTVYTLTVVG